MGLPNGKKTKTGYSTSADVLEKLASETKIMTDVPVAVNLANKFISAIIGKNTDADTALTIYGVRKYAVTNCTNLQNTINNKLSWCVVTGHKSSTTTKSPV